jgi:hypothetical protein
MEILFAAASSLLIQFIKTKMQTTEYGTLGMVLLVSFVASAIYVWLYDTELWETLVTIITIAGAIYTYLIQRFEEDSALRGGLSKLPSPDEV